MLIRKMFQTKSKPKKEISGQVTSTPNGSETGVVTPDISIIEPTNSLPAITSTDSIEILEPNIFDKLHASHMHPTGAEIIQHAGHCTLPSYLTPNTIRRKLGLGRRTQPSQDPYVTNYMQRLAKELQKSVNNEKSKPQNEPLPASNTESSENPEESHQPSLTELNLVTEKLAKSSSPFKENFAIQTLQLSTKETSPLQSLTNSTKTTVGLQDDLNLVATCTETPRSARSYPSTPRETSHPWVNFRSRSQSPPPRNQDQQVTTTQRRLTTTLKDIVGKITSTFLTPESKSPASSTECPQSRVVSKSILRGVRFAGGRATRDVQELYFNKGVMDEVQSSHDPYSKQGFGSTTYPPWVQVARSISKNQSPQISGLGCKCENPASSAIAPCQCMAKTSTSSQPMISPRGPSQSPKVSFTGRPQTAPARSSMRPQQSSRPKSPASLPRQPLGCICGSPQRSFQQQPRPPRPPIPFQLPSRPARPPMPLQPQFRPTLPSMPLQPQPPMPLQPQPPMPFQPQPPMPFQPQPPMPFQPQRPMSSQPQSCPPLPYMPTQPPPCPSSPQPCMPCQQQSRQLHPLQPQPQTCSPCSKTDTGISDSDSVRSLQSKLVATQICLRNKEETVRVQSESLACAEQRIAMLTLRAAQQRCQLEDLQRELCKQREEAETNSCCEGPSEPCCKAADVCCQSEEADTGVKRQKMVVKTLQNNLSVIEELYRECFYETAKQEELIEKLRKSYLDVRLMEKEKADRIGRLENVVNAQKWTLETCQGVAVEVENLKMEILNFLNSSNNDSGVWEQSVAGEIGEDINDIMQLLHQLREMLQTEDGLDTCILRSENKNLRDLNRNLEYKIKCMEEDKCRTEATMREKEDAIIALRKEKDGLCLEMRSLRTELEANQKRVCDLTNENDCVRKQLKEAQAEVGETKSEIGCVRCENDELRQKNSCLTEEIERADLIIKENLKIRSSVSYLTQQVALWRQQLAESEERVRCVEAELARARCHVRTVDQCYREKVDAVEALETQLQQAHARGARLCAESRRVVCSVRAWVRRMQATNREQSQTIKDQESVINQLEEELREEKQKQMHSPCPEHRSPCPEHRSPCPEHRSPCPERPCTPPCQFADYYTSYRTQRHVADHREQTQFPTGLVRAADSDDVIVGCSKCARGFRPEVTADYQVGCSKCAPKMMGKQRMNDETESGSVSFSHAAGACGCERDSNAAQTTVRTTNTDDAASCSHIPVPPRRLLRKKLYNDRVAHFLRCTGGAAREAGVQGPQRSDCATSPPRPCPRSRIPRAVSPTSELLERVSHLNDAMEESQRRWSRTKLTQAARDRR